MDSSHLKTDPSKMFSLEETIRKGSETSHSVIISTAAFKMLKPGNALMVVTESRPDTILMLKSDYEKLLKKG